MMFTVYIVLSLKNEAFCKLIAAQQRENTLTNPIAGRSAPRIVPMRSWSLSPQLLVRNPTAISPELAVRLAELSLPFSDVTVYIFLRYNNICCLCIDFMTSPLSVVYIRRFVCKILNECPLDYKAVAREGWARKPVVTPTDRPKSVRNRCVIEFFVEFFCCHFATFVISVRIRTFVMGQSDLFLFLYCLCNFNHLHKGLSFIVVTQCINKSFHYPDANIYPSAANFCHHVEINDDNYNE